MFISLQAEYRHGSSLGGDPLKLGETIRTFGRLLTSCWCYHASRLTKDIKRSECIWPPRDRVSQKPKMLCHWLKTNYFTSLEGWAINPIPWFVCFLILQAGKKKSSILHSWHNATVKSLSASGRRETRNLPLAIPVWFFFLLHTFLWIRMNEWNEGAGQQCSG